MDYLKRIEKALLYIEKNIKRKITLEEVAKEACFSYFHFHRIFMTIIGDTLGNYIRKRRLTLSSGDLIYTNRDIIEIALNYCFESHEAYTRSFKQVFGVSPWQYRKNRINKMIGVKNQLTIKEIKHLDNGITKEPDIQCIDELKIIGIRGLTSLKNNRIKSVWDNFMKRIDEIKNRINYPDSYGICENNENYNLNDFTEDTEYYIFTGVEVSNFDFIPVDMDTKIVKKGKYAVFTHKGNVEDLRITYDYVWGTWIFKTDLELDNRDDFELYGKNFYGRENKNSSIDIFIPVK